MMNNKIKFRKSETFYLRDGWIEKAINSIKGNEDIFSKNNGISILGIGSNMVKGLKYWLQAANIINVSNSITTLTDFGELLLEYDKYIESNFSLFLIHYNLVTNKIECPLFYGLFNSDIKSFTKNDFIEKMMAYYKDYDVNKDYIDDDTKILLKSYINENNGDNPEDNYVCPLSNLKLLEKKGDKYKKTRPFYRNLSYLIIYYCLGKQYNYSQFNIEESYAEVNSPMNLFNLDKNMYLQYLDEMKKHKLIIINKTAGLNTVYFEKELDLEEIFGKYFGKENK